MKRRLWIAAGILLIIALAVGIGFWKEAQTIKWQTAHMHELSHILIFAEDKGADRATDALVLDGVERFSRKSLYKKWGNPDESAEDAKEDIWILSDRFRLVVTYDDQDRVEHVRVVPGK